ncbi:hypothetical protein OSCT_2386 [Oscillochloris trichoides DG-6]|uniref:Uncharacterized protein n=1 Tax=Oscillochloris trichoides DG-6 TaxID=765420 RepID=E1IGD5_9CHLR|nr:hypothetical protein [Oscillochloris trichoides]EFO79701.1 hypothetical protein OSCT_2386 [Oscillochloris trichoides DG-6]
MSNEVWRVKEADAARITELVGQKIGFPCSQVIGQALWFEEEQTPTLSKIEQVPDATALRLQGDFGHIFGPSIELRWRRINADRYDVLILSDSALDVEGAEPLGAEPLGAEWKIEHKQLHQQATAHYLAPNGAVQFVSYRHKEGGQQ